MDTTFQPIIDGSHSSIEEETMFFQTLSMKLLTDIALLNKKPCLDQLSLLSKFPTKENLSDFLLLLSGCADRIDKSDSFLSEGSNVQFYSVKFTLITELKKIRENLAQADIEIMISNFYKPFFDKIFLLPDPTIWE